VRHFLSNELLAVNVMKVPVDPAIVAEFEPIAREPLDRSRFGCVSNPRWNSDVKWISARTEDGFNLFESAFTRLDVAKWVEPYIDFENQVRMFGGHLVVRTECTEPSFHVDWMDGKNEGFTLLTPITDNTAGFGLIYKKLNGELGEYEYKLGEALIIGSNFLHSTSPGRSEQPVALLSFTFGTDKMEHWGKLAETAANQSPLYRRPDGVLCHNRRLD